MRVQSISKDASGTVTGMEVALHLEGDVKKTKWKMTWLAQVGGWMGGVVLPCACTGFRLHGAHMSCYRFNRH